MEWVDRFVLDVAVPIDDDNDLEEGRVTNRVLL